MCSGWPSPCSTPGMKTPSIAARTESGRGVPHRPGCSCRSYDLSGRRGTCKLDLYRTAALQELPDTFFTDETVLHFAEVYGPTGIEWRRRTFRGSRRNHGEVGEAARGIAALDIDHDIGGQVLGQQRLRACMQRGAHRLPALDHLTRIHRAGHRAIFRKAVRGGIHIAQVQRPNIGMGEALTGPLDLDALDGAQ